MELAEYSVGLGAWLDANEELCAPQRHLHHLELVDMAPAQRALQRALFDAGWVRYGWPESVGGLGGDARHRATLYDELTRRRVPVPETYLTLETLIPMLVEYTPALAPAFVPLLLRGDEAWCQGFSEPDAGSDLASLRTRAVRDGDEWVLDGQKVWTSQASIAQRCVVLARTGTPESRHKGLSMFLVDHDTPGVTVRPIRAMTGRDEFGELFFDGARIPADRLIGAEGAGWSVAMYLLQWERGMYPWQRQGWLHVLLDSVIDQSGDSADPGALADAFLAVTTMRLKARQTIRRLAAGENPGPEISVDKILLARGDQAVTDVAERLLSPVLQLGDDDRAEAWRQEYLFGRAAPIYGGSIEIQRSILADRVLGLPRGVIMEGRLDTETVEMVTATLRGVLSAEGDATAGLVEAGWRDVLAEDAESIVPVQFRLQGELLARSRALDDVVRVALGADGQVVHPMPGRTSAFGADGGVDGLAFAPVDGLEATPLRGLDPDLGLVRVAGSARGGIVDGGTATTAARRALAAELTGVARTMLATATQHAKVRLQYGQPIGTFQAVKFRLADVLVAIQAAEVVAEEAWGEEAELGAAAAKCLAGQAFRLAAENCLQVLGAIGFTWEHDLHRFTRRGLVLDVLYGSAHDLRAELGRALVARGSAPRLGGL